MKDDNDILIKKFIVRDISFNGSISGTTDVLVDAVNLFGKRYLIENQFQNHNCCTRNT